MLYLDWQIEPVLIGLITTLATAYYVSVGPLRRRLAPREKFPTAKALLFGLALVLLFLNEGSPLHDLAERYLLSAHMIQHLLLSYVVTPLLIAGTPAWLFRAAFANPSILPTMRVVFHPLMTFAAFALVMAIYHLPRLYDLSLVNTSLHHSVHIIILIASVMVWWPIMSPIKELPRPPYLVRVAYLFLLPVAQLPIFAFVTFAHEPLYQVYAHMPTRAFGLSVMEDQAIGGIVMKVAGVVAFGIPFIFTFLSWYRSEVSKDDPRRAHTLGAASGTAAQDAEGAPAAATNAPAVPSGRAARGGAR